MPIRIVRLGTERHPDEGLRIGTVRRPPRGVPKSAFATGNWYDVWYPNLAPSAETVKLAMSAKSNEDWRFFKRSYLAEMRDPKAARTLDLLAQLSHHGRFSLGCYCEDETKCHRGILRELLQKRGAHII